MYVNRTNPLIRTAADLVAARRDGFTNSRFEHKRDATYHFQCLGQDVSRVRCRRRAELRLHSGVVMCMFNGVSDVEVLVVVSP